jgi:anti-anti-sigma factor
MACQELFDAWAPRLTAGIGPVILDLSELTFIDSTGLRCLLVLASRTAVVIRHPQPAVRRVFTIAGLDHRGEIRIEP